MVKVRTQQQHVLSKNIGTRVALFRSSCPWCGYNLKADPRYISFTEYHVKNRTNLPIQIACLGCGVTITVAS